MRRDTGFAIRSYEGMGDRRSCTSRKRGLRQEGFSSKPSSMLRMRSRSHVFGFVASLLLFPSALSRGAESAGNSVENSVVKIFATVRYPDYFRPWAKLAPMEVTGSGVVVRGLR